MSKQIKKHMTKTVLIIAVCILLAAAAAGGTAAYMKKKTAAVTNKVIPVSFSVDIQEKTEDGALKNLSVKNTGSMPAYVRIKLIINWKNADGNVYGVRPVKDKDYTLTIPDGNGWLYDKPDSLWYYKNPVAPNTNTGIFIAECKPVSPSTAPAGYTLSVEAAVQAIRTVPVEDIFYAWPIDIGENGEIILFD